jgi:hypothetical protein
MSAGRCAVPKAKSRETYQDVAESSRLYALGEDNLAVSREGIPSGLPRVTKRGSMHGNFARGTLNFIGLERSPIENGNRQTRL